MGPRSRAVVYDDFPVSLKIRDSRLLILLAIAKEVDCGVTESTSQDGIVVWAAAAGP
jgi:hypothetical protein